MPIKSVFGLVQEAKQCVENLSVAELRSEMANGDALVVDLRELQERADAGTIPGSKHAPRGMLEFWADPASPYYRQWFQEDRRIVLFCAGGARSALAARDLGHMGFANVAHLEPGFQGWRNAGGPVEDVATTTSRWMRRKHLA